MIFIEDNVFNPKREIMKSYPSTTLPIDKLVYHYRPTHPQLN